MLLAYIVANLHLHANATANKLTFKRYFVCGFMMCKLYIKLHATILYVYIL